MLALQICSTAVTYLSALPTQQWTQLTAQAYDCPVRLVQAQNVVGMQAFVEKYSRQHLGQDNKALKRQWRILPLERASEAQTRDGLLLPADPLTLLWQPRAYHQAKMAQARGVALVLDTPTVVTLPALATTYTGLGLIPRAALLRTPPAHLSTLPSGTYVLPQVDGLPLLPRVVREGQPGARAGQGQHQFVPYLPGETQGEWASPGGSQTTLTLNPALSWRYGQLDFSSGQALRGRAAALAKWMVLGWGMGQILTRPLPSLIYTASDTIAWVVLALLVLTVTALVRSLFRRPDTVSLLEVHPDKPDIELTDVDVTDVEGIGEGRAAEHTDDFQRRTSVSASGERQ